MKTQEGMMIEFIDQNRLFDLRAFPRLYPCALKTMFARVWQGIIIYGLCTSRSINLLRGWVRRGDSSQLMLLINIQYSETTHKQIALRARFLVGDALECLFTILTLCSTVNTEQ